MDGFIAPRVEPRADWATTLAEIAAAAAQHDRDASFPFENFARLHAAGLLGLNVRRVDGGAGASLAETGRIVGELGRACSSTALVFAMQAVHQHLIATGAGWPEAARALVGQSAVDRGALANALRVEPDLGTPARGGLPATVARAAPDGWVVNGRKIYSTGAPGLTWLLVWARTDEADPRTGIFLVPAQAPGVRIEPSWDHLGLRATGSHDVVLDNVAIPADYDVDLRLPAAWGAPDPVQAVWYAVTLGALYTGVARAARDWLIHFLRTRVPSNLGAPLATLPRMQEAVGAIEALLTANARLIDAMAAAYDRGETPSAVESGLLKAVVAENAIEAVQQAVKLTGNHALARTNPLERHLRDVLCARIHTPQPDAAFAAAGRVALA